jgi:hypothetical protein
MIKTPQPPSPSPIPRIWAHIRGRYWSAKINFVTPFVRYRVYNNREARTQKQINYLETCKRIVKNRKKVLFAYLCNSSLVSENQRRGDLRLNLLCEFRCRTKLYCNHAPEAVRLNPLSQPQTLFKSRFKEFISDIQRRSALSKRAI